MINLKRLIGAAADAFDQVTTPDFPLSVGNGDVGGNKQAIDSASVSHLSHFSHPELLRLEAEEDEAQFSVDYRRAGARGIGDALKTAGKVGTVGNASNGNDLFFPPIISKVGKVGKDGLAVEPPSATAPARLTMNRTGSATMPTAWMATASTTSPPSRRWWFQHGFSDSHARDERHPLATVPAIPRQTDIFRCFICGVHETAEKPLLPVLSEIRGEHHWLHRGCWSEHSHRCAQARAAATAPASRERVAS